MTPPSPSLASTPALTREILVVDDEVLVAQTVGRQLTRLGFRATTCTSPDAALALVIAAPSRFVAVIADFGMPGMNGVALAEAIRAHAPDLPILLATGAIEEEVPASRALAAILCKPYGLAVLSEALALIVT